MKNHHAHLSKGQSPLQKRYDTLCRNHEELLDYVRSLQEDLDRDHIELMNMSAFIEYKRLNEEYTFFREHAREVYDDERPFPILTL